MEKINHELQLEELRQLAQSNLIIPFIGAGFSSHLGLPTWSQLVDFIAAELGYDPDIFKSQGNAMQLAEYYILKKNGDITELTSKLQDWFNSEKIDISDSEQHMLLARLKPPIIYTTNYDNLIEKAFHASEIDYTLIAQIEDLRKIRSSITQIVKFHGTFGLNHSIVLSESHYFNRLSLESALDIKLRHDLLGRSLVFIGYNFQDLNMRYMWYKLLQLWKSQVSKIKLPSKSYFVGFGIGIIQKTILLEMYNIVAIELDPKDKTKSLVDFLKAIQ